MSHVFVFSARGFCLVSAGDCRCRIMQYLDRASFLNLVSSFLCFCDYSRSRYVIFSVEVV